MASHGKSERRFRASWAFSLFIAACSANGDVATPPRGWWFDADPKWPGVIYSFGDASATKFVGRCHGKPVFSLSGGDYPRAPTPVFNFELLLDERRFTFEGEENPHGRILVMEEPSAVNEMVNAKTIRIRVGDWERSLPGSPLIGRLVQACETFRPSLPKA